MMHFNSLMQGQKTNPTRDLTTFLKSCSHTTTLFAQKQMSFATWVAWHFPSILKVIAIGPGC